MKTTYIIIGAVLLLILGGLIVLSQVISHKPTTVISPSVTPTIEEPTIIQTSTNSPRVMMVSPADNAVNIPLNTTITMTFNKNLVPNNTTFAIEPAVPFYTQFNNDVLTITFKSPLSSGTLYTYIVKFADTGEATTTHHFTTTGPTQEFLPDTRPSGLEDAQNQQLLQQSPDVYVSNLLPYENDSFSANFEYSSTPKGHFKITVTLKGDQTTAKNNFIAWLKSNGLNDSQIATLDLQFN